MSFFHFKYYQFYKCKIQSSNTQEYQDDCRRHQSVYYTQPSWNERWFCASPLNLQWLHSYNMDVCHIKLHTSCAAVTDKYTHELLVLEAVMSSSTATCVHLLLQHLLVLSKFTPYHRSLFLKLFSVSPYISVALWVLVKRVSSKDISKLSKCVKSTPGCVHVYNLVPDLYRWESNGKPLN